MQIEPHVTAFAKRYARGEAQVVWTTLVSDLETPVSAFLKIAGARPLSFLLESVEGGALRGRYSIIGLNPDLVWRTVAGRAEINRRAQQSADSFTPCGGPALAALRALIADSRIELPDVLPPMAAGIFGYLGYDMVRLMEELPPPKADPIGIPDAMLVRPSVVVVFDTVKDVITVVTPVRPESGVSAEVAFTRARERLSAIVDALDAPLAHSLPDVQAGPLTVWPSSNITPAEYERMVNVAKEYIAAGDIFQVVLSQRFEAPFELPPFALYRALRRVNPAPFLYFLDFGGFSIAGSSPEILVRVREGTVTIRPLAGTRRRTRHSRSSCSRMKKNAPSISCCSILAATMSAGSHVRPPSRSPISSSSSASARLCTLSPTWRVSSTENMTRSTPSRPASQRAPSRVRLRCARCRSSTNSNRRSVGFMPAPWVISPPRASSTAASCCARR